MKKLIKSTHDRKSLRLPDFDYSQDGAYFVTIVTQNRTCLFGSVVGGEMVINEAGRMLDQVCQEIPIVISSVGLEYYVIMPNHFHAIIILNNDARFVQADLPQVPGAGSVYPSEEYNTGQPQRIAPTQDTVSLPNVIQRFKSLTTCRYISGVQQRDWPRFNGRLWHRNYYEHVIRNERDYQGFVDYIAMNPLSWEKDEEYRC